MAADKAQKGKFIEKWKSKGIDSVIYQLWIANQRAATFHRTLLKKKEECDDLAVISKRLLSENENLKTVLQENGIRPQKLRIKYRSCDCRRCEYSGFDGDCNYDGDWYAGDAGPCVYKAITRTCSFYTYEIKDNEITGILYDFTECNFDVISVVDGNTGKVIYERSEEE